MGLTLLSRILALRAIAVLLWASTSSLKRALKQKECIEAASLHLLRDHLLIKVEALSQQIDTLEKQEKGDDWEFALVHLHDERLATAAQKELLDVMVAEPEYLTTTGGELYLRFLFRRYDEIEAQLAHIAVPDTATPASSPLVKQRNGLEDEQYCVTKQIQFLSTLCSIPTEKIECIQDCISLHHLPEAERTTHGYQEDSHCYPLIHQWMHGSVPITTLCFP